MGGGTRSGVPLYAFAKQSGLLNNLGYYNDDPQRAVNRHTGRCNTAYVDGHAQAIKVSLIGLQYFPGKNAAGQTATGVTWLGGNERYDPRWMWDLE